MTAAFPIRAFLAFARKQPANKRYDYHNDTECAVAQFGRENGHPELVGKGALWNVPREINALVYEGEHTFGSLVKRLEVVCQPVRERVLA